MIDPYQTETDLAEVKPKNQDVSIHLLVRQVDRAGGAEIYTEELLRQLFERGYRVTLICYDALEEIARYCTVRQLKEVGSTSVPGMWRFDALRLKRNVGRSIAALELVEPTLAIASDPILASGYALRFPDVPLIYVPHGVIAPLELKSYKWSSSLQRFTTMHVYSGCERHVLNHSTCTLRFTKLACDQLLEWYGGRISPNFSITPPAVRMPVEGEKNGDNSVFRILTAGRLIPSKNVDFLITALVKLQELQWQLDIVGAGPELDQLKLLVEKHLLSDRIRFHGYQNDMSAWYRNADLFAFPSRLEYAPLVLLEAMSYGVPTLSIQNDGMRYVNANHEFVTPDWNGLIAENESDFSHKLARAINSQSQLRIIGERARVTVSDHHSWSRHIEAYERIITTCMLSQNKAT